MFRLPSGEVLLGGLYRACRGWDADLSAFTVNVVVCSATLGHLDQDTGELRCQALGVGRDLVGCCCKGRVVGR